MLSIMCNPETDRPVSHIELVPGSKFSLIEVDALEHFGTLSGV